MNSFEKITAFLYHAFFPNRCPFCDRVIPYLDECCPDCAKELIPREDASIDLGPERMLDSAFAPYSYHSIAKQAVWNLKFFGSQQSAIPMARMMASVLKDHPEIRCDCIIPVPLSRAKHYRRGYNQSEELGRTLASILDIPQENNVLRKIRQTSDQHRLSAQERAENLTGAFRVFRPKAVKGKRILLVDDVFTTGWTMHECARMLKQAGALSVTGITFCRAGEGEDHEEPQTFGEDALLESRLASR